MQKFEPTSSPKQEGLGAEKWFQLMVEAASNAMLMVDASRKITFVNRGTEALFGYDRDELLGRNVEALIPERFRAAHLGHVQAFIRDPKTRSIGAGRELFGRRKDGSEVPIEIGLNPIQTPDGMFTLASISDITERKRAEERFRLVVEAAPNAMLVVDRTGKITLVNRSAERVFGYAREELIGQLIETLIPARLREHHSGHVQGFLLDPKARSMGAGRELFGLRKDGSEVPIEIGLNPIEAPDGMFTLASIIDITERKHAEERFRLVVEATPNAMLMADSQRTITLVNRKTEDMFGYGREELIGQALEILVPERFRKRHPALVSGFFVEPQARAMGAGRELFGRRKDGSEVPIEIGLNPIDTPEGVFTLASIIDITERKRNEDELRRSNADLEQFAYIASHDLQEPLRMVASYTELLAQRYRGKLDHKADQYIFYAVDGAKRMQCLVSDLLAYSQVGSQGKPLVSVAVDGVLANVLGLLRASIQSANASIEVGPLPTVLADEGQLRQLFQNLLGNALKFRGDAPPRISIEATRLSAAATAQHPKREATSNQDRQGDRWLFSVKDNGIGIEMQYADRIFQMFQRLHERGKYEGSGIGLSIAKRILERHGGRIWLESVAGQGTTFFFTLQHSDSKGS